MFSPFRLGVDCETTMNVRLSLSLGLHLLTAHDGFRLWHANAHRLDMRSPLCLDFISIEREGQC